MGMGRRYDTNRSQCWLNEFPSICIDRFDKEIHGFNQKEHFFLTHAHNDHIYGFMNKYGNMDFLNKLLEPENTMRLYMHEATIPHLIYWDRGFTIEILNDLLEKGKIILLNLKMVEFNITVSDEKVNVKWHSAGHCPGSIMLSFWKDHFAEDRILYTGDCRITIEDLKREFPNENEYPNKIYLDTTFCHNDFFNKVGKREDYIKRILTGENKQRTFFVTSKVDQLYLFQRIVERENLNAIVQVPSKNYLNLVKSYLPACSAEKFFVQEKIGIVGQGVINMNEENGQVKANSFVLELYDPQKRSIKGEIMSHSVYGGSHLTPIEIVGMLEYFNLLNYNDDSTPFVVPLCYNERHWNGQEMFGEDKVAQKVKNFIENILQNAEKIKNFHRTILVNESEKIPSYSYDYTHNVDILKNLDLKVHLEKDVINIQVKMVVEDLIQQVEFNTSIK